MAEKLSFKREETSSRTWNIRGDLPAEDQPGKERKEERDRTERMGGREERRLYIDNIIQDKLNRNVFSLVLNMEVVSVSRLNPNW